MTLLGTYMRGNHRTVWSGGLVALLGELGFSTGAARVSLTRLADRDLLARVREGRLIHYQLTPRAERVLAEGDLRIFGLGEVPAEVESWTIIWHKIPESQRPERGQLAKRLRFLGFGSLQDGLWVSPSDHEAELAQLIEELGISGRAGVFVGRLSQASAAEATLERAWDLDGLCRRYEAFVVEFAPYRRSRSLEEREAFLVRTRLVHLYRTFASLDPGLPDRMMPRRRARAQAVAAFDTIYANLAEPAQRHFDRLTTPS
ncbi:MAG: PaaX family transcriptional regulator [Actinobacteria bacterium]|nr:PaaX family transcriptional regulator [Actinomycetota bacterium]